MALDRLRRCPEEIGDEFWPTRAKKKDTHSQTTKIAVKPKEPTVEVPTPEKVPQIDNAKGVWSGRLRSHKRVNVGEDAST